MNTRVTVIGVIFIIIGFYQLYAVIGYFKFLKKHGNSSTSPFSLFGLWTSLMFSLLTIGIGFGAVFHLI